MDKYALTKWFRYHRRLQVYMYDFMYVDTETMPLGRHFPATKTFVAEYKKMSTPVPVNVHKI